VGQRAREIERDDGEKGKKKEEEEEEGKKNIRDSSVKIAARKVAVGWFTKCSMRRQPATVLGKTTTELEVRSPGGAVSFSKVQGCLSGRRCQKDHRLSPVPCRP
jgi:hypothetical protein